MLSGHARGDEKQSKLYWIVDLKVDSLLYTR